jgi:hypothetical protein
MAWCLVKRRTTVTLPLGGQLDGYSVDQGFPCYWYSDRLRAGRSDDWGSIPGRGWEFSPRHHVQSGSGAHLASYPMGTRGSFPRGKAAVAWSWPLTSIKCRVQRMRGAVPPLPQYVFMAWCLVWQRSPKVHHSHHKGSSLDSILDHLNFHCNHFNTKKTKFQGTYTISFLIQVAATHKTAQCATLPLRICEPNHKPVCFVSLNKSHYSYANVKLSPCLTKHHATKTYGWMEIQLHAFLTLALDGDEWLASQPGRLNPRERAPGAHWIGGWLDPRVGLDAIANRKENLLQFRSFL